MHQNIQTGIYVRILRLWSKLTSCKLRHPPSSQITVEHNAYDSSTAENMTPHSFQVIFVPLSLPL